MIALPREAFQRISPNRKKHNSENAVVHAHQETYPRVLILAASRNIGVAIVELIELDGAE